MQRFKANIISDRTTIIVQNDDGTLDISWNKKSLCAQCKPETARLDYRTREPNLVWDCEAAEDGFCVLGIDLQGEPHDN